MKPLQQNITHVRVLSINPGEKPLGAMYEIKEKPAPEPTALTELLAPGKKSGMRFSILRFVSSLFGC